jgi:hypothetical protein
MSLSTQTTGSAGLNPPATVQAGTANRHAPGASLPAALLLSQGGLKAASLQALADGGEPDQADQDLFKMLLAGKGPNDASTDGEEQGGIGYGERNTSTELRDAVKHIAQGHETAARQKHNSQEQAAIPPLDTTALSGVVSRVYLENDLNRERVVHMALNDDLLPATKLSIFERSGRLAVDFVSLNITTRERLRRGAHGLAQRIAGDLARDVSVRVAAHDNDRRALEVCADAKPAAQTRGAA